jgi:hypothetical protein
MMANHSIEKLVNITSRLGDLIGQENGILTHHRAHELTASQQEKERLIGEYEFEMNQVNGNPGAVAAASAETLERLKDATRRFRDVMEEHRRLVQSAKSVSDRMIKTITEEVSQRQRPVTGYTAQAQMRTPFARNQKPVSLALNQVV